MSGILILGFLLGLQHALEADHLAAMATIVSRTRNLQQTAWHGAVWGIGHSITLFVFSSIALLMGEVIPDNFASMLEMLVGAMLIMLGIDVLIKLKKQRIHFHSHVHDDGIRHFHAHAHRHDVAHDLDPHQHVHPEPLPKRTLLVGLMHGLAGSAALILLTAQTTQSLSNALLYILLFGTGSIIGMATLSIIIMLPMRKLRDKGLEQVYQNSQITIAAMTMGLGSYVIWHNAAFLL